MKTKLNIVCSALAGLSASAGSITDCGDYLLADGSADSPAEINAKTTYDKPLWVGRDGIEGALKVSAT